MPALRGLNNKVAVTIHDKKALIRPYAFPKPPVLKNKEYFLEQRSVTYLLAERWLLTLCFISLFKKYQGLTCTTFANNA